jgi:hypothetical protein
MSENRCTHCGQYKPPSAFPPNDRTRSGRSSWCRPCHVAATKAWRAREHEAGDELPAAVGSIEIALDISLMMFAL